MRCIVFETLLSISSEYEEKYIKEGTCLSTLLSILQIAKDGEEISALRALQTAKAKLLVTKKYKVKRVKGVVPLSKMIVLDIEKDVNTDWLELKKPENIKLNGVATGMIFTNFTINIEQEKVLSKNELDIITYKALLQKKEGEDKGKEYGLRKDDNCFYFIPSSLEAETAYTVKVKTVFQGGKESGWSEKSRVHNTRFFRVLCLERVSWLCW